MPPTKLYSWRCRSDGRGVCVARLPSLSARVLEDLERRVLRLVDRTIRFGGLEVDVASIGRLGLALWLWPHRLSRRPRTSRFSMGSTVPVPGPRSRTSVIDATRFLASGSVTRSKSSKFPLGRLKFPPKFPTFKKLLSLYGNFGNYPKIQKS